MAVQKTTFRFPSASGYGVTLHGFQWKDDAQEPVGIVQITHGLSENTEMFEALAIHLAEHGYVCAGIDFLGHGATVGAGCVGICPPDTNEAIWEDMLSLYTRLRDRYPGLPHFAFSHSMGAMMFRAFLAKYADRLDIKACFFTGDSALPSFTWRLIPAAHVLGRAIMHWPKDLEKRKAKFVRKDYGEHPPLLNQLMIRWISFDRQNRLNYINSPYSGGPNADFRFVLGFVLTAFSTFALADKKGWAETIPDRTVLHHGCGRWDIPGFLGFGPKIVHKNLKAAGKKTELHLYKKAMHEVHGETKIRDEFHADLLDLFDRNNPLRNS